jgi:TET-associated glycosyltransferase-like protein
MGGMRSLAFLRRCASVENAAKLTKFIQGRPVIPIYIPSKGKFNGDTPTTSLLKAGRREYKIFVEPQEVTAYQKHHKDVLSLEKSGQRIGYARREIQRYADLNEVEVSWILDDDLKAFYRIPDRKGEPSVKTEVQLSFTKQRNRYQM